MPPPALKPAASSSSNSDSDSPDHSRFRRGGQGKSAGNSSMLSMLSDSVSLLLDQGTPSSAENTTAKKRYIDPSTYVPPPKPAPVRRNPPPQTYNPQHQRPVRLTREELPPQFDQDSNDNPSYGIDSAFVSKRELLRRQGREEQVVEVAENASLRSTKSAPSTPPPPPPSSAPPRQVLPPQPQDAEKVHKSQHITFAEDDQPADEDEHHEQKPAMAIPPVDVVIEEPQPPLSAESKMTSETSSPYQDLLQAQTTDRQPIFSTTGGARPIVIRPATRSQGADSRLSLPPPPQVNLDLLSNMEQYLNWRIITGGSAGGLHQQPKAPALAALDRRGPHHKEDAGLGSPNNASSSSSSIVKDNTVEAVMSDFLTNFFPLSSATNVNVTMQQFPLLSKLVVLQSRVIGTVMALVSTRPIIGLYELQQEVCHTFGVDSFAKLGLGISSILGLNICRSYFSNFDFYHFADRQPQGAPVPQPPAVLTSHFIRWALTDPDAQAMLVSTAGCDTIPLLQSFSDHWNSVYDRQMREGGSSRRSYADTNAIDEPRPYAFRLKYGSRSLGFHVQNLSWLTILLREGAAHAAKGLMAEMNCYVGAPTTTGAVAGADLSNDTVPRAPPGAKRQRGKRGGGIGQDAQKVHITFADDDDDGISMDGQNDSTNEEAPFDTVAEEPVEEPPAQNNHAQRQHHQPGEATSFDFDDLEEDTEPLIAVPGTPVLAEAAPSQIDLDERSATAKKGPTLNAGLLSQLAKQLGDLDSVVGMPPEQLIAYLFPADFRGLLGQEDTTGIAALCNSGTAQNDGPEHAVCRLVTFVWWAAAKLHFAFKVDGDKSTAIPHPILFGPPTLRRTNNGVTALPNDDILQSLASSLERVRDYCLKLLREFLSRSNGIDSDGIELNAKASQMISDRFFHGLSPIINFVPSDDQGGHANSVPSCDSAIVGGQMGAMLPFALSMPPTILATANPPADGTAVSYTDKRVLNALADLVTFAPSLVLEVVEVAEDEEAEGHRNHHHKHHHHRHHAHSGNFSLGKHHHKKGQSDVALQPLRILLNHLGDLQANHESPIHNLRSIACLLRSSPATFATLILAAWVAGVRLLKQWSSGSQVGKQDQSLASFPVASQSNAQWLSGLAERVWWLSAVLLSCAPQRSTVGGPSFTAENVLNPLAALPISEPLVPIVALKAFVPLSSKPCIIHGIMSIGGDGFGNGGSLLTALNGHFSLLNRSSSSYSNSTPLKSLYLFSPTFVPSYMFGCGGGVDRSHDGLENSTEEVNDNADLIAENEEEELRLAETMQPLRSPHALMRRFMLEVLGFVDLPSSASWAPTFLSISHLPSSQVHTFISQRMPAIQFKLMERFFGCAWKKSDGVECSKDRNSSGGSDIDILHPSHFMCCSPSLLATHLLGNSSGASASSINCASSKVAGLSLVCEVIRAKLERLRVVVCSGLELNANFTHPVYGTPMIWRSMPAITGGSVSSATGTSSSSPTASLISVPFFYSEQSDILYINDSDCDVLRLADAVAEAIIPRSLSCDDVFYGLRVFLRKFFLEGDGWESLSAGNNSSAPSKAGGLGKGRAVSRYPQYVSADSFVEDVKANPGSSTINLQKLPQAWTVSPPPFFKARDQYPPGNNAMEIRVATGSSGGVNVPSQHTNGAGTLTASGSPQAANGQNFIAQLIHRAANGPAPSDMSTFIEETNVLGDDFDGEAFIAAMGFGHNNESASVGHKRGREHHRHGDEGSGKNKGGHRSEGNDDSNTTEGFLSFSSNGSPSGGSKDFYSGDRMPNVHSFSTNATANSNAGYRAALAAAATGGGATGLCFEEGTSNSANAKILRSTLTYPVSSATIPTFAPSTAQAELSSMSSGSKSVAQGASLSGDLVHHSEDYARSAERFTFQRLHSELAGAVALLQRLVATSNSTAVKIQPLSPTTGPPTKARTKNPNDMNDTDDDDDDEHGTMSPTSYDQRSNATDQSPVAITDIKSFMETLVSESYLSSVIGNLIANNADQRNYHHRNSTSVPLAAVQRTLSELQDLRYLWIHEHKEQGTPYDIVLIKMNQTPSRQGGNAIPTVLEFIEVKSTSTKARKTFELSVRELVHMVRHRSTFMVARVYNAYYNGDGSGNNGGGADIRHNLRGMQIELLRDPLYLWQRQRLNFQGNIQVVIV